MNMYEDYGPNLVEQAVREKMSPDASAGQLAEALDVYENEGDAALREHLNKQTWGVKGSGYEPHSALRGFVLTAVSGIRFSRRHIQPRREVQYMPQDRDVVSRFRSYQYNLRNRLDMRPLVHAFGNLYERHIGDFAEPERLGRVLTTKIPELMGSPEPAGMALGYLRRIAGQAYTTIFMLPVYAFRNIHQNPAMETDSANLLHPDVFFKKMSEGTNAYLDEQVQQTKGLQDVSFLAEKPIFLPRLTRLARKSLLYIMSDVFNRAWSFKGKTLANDRAFAAHPKDGVALAKALHLSDLEWGQQMLFWEIYARDGQQAAFFYLGREHTTNIHVAYRRGERSAIEQGVGGREMTSLAGFLRSTLERYMLQIGKLGRKDMPARERARAAHVLASMTIKGIVVSKLYMMITGKKREPYAIQQYLSWTPGGFAINPVIDMFRFIEAVVHILIPPAQEVKRKGWAAAAGHHYDKAVALATRIADTLVPGYRMMTDMLEGLFSWKHLDRKFMRQFRETFDKKYKVKDDWYRAERTWYEVLQKVFFQTETAEPPKGRPKAPPGRAQKTRTRLRKRRKLRKP